MSAKPREHAWDTVRALQVSVKRQTEGGPKEDETARKKLGVSQRRSESERNRDARFGREKTDLEFSTQIRVSHWVNVSLISAGQQTKTTPRN